ncbi:MAG TPA: PGF-pre-PGF domain-containing protein, partial [Candidatus Nanoarchaeia archaeon]|nr:PGF-pre-PGF domain-containing protein [Candidatus Nanoarchaeia archaeon]
ALEWSKSKTLAGGSAETILVRVFGRDNAGNTGVSLLMNYSLADSTSPNITFVFPTPPNNTQTSNNTLFINITANESISIALLDFNFTNYTMSGSGTNWYLNLTVVSNQNSSYTYKVWGNDSSGNMAQSEFRIFVSNNTPPRISAFQPTATVSIPEGDYSFIFNATLADTENDPLSYTWTKNGSLASTSANFSFANNFSAAGVYLINLSVTDGNFTIVNGWDFNVTNNNRLPQVTSINITNSDYLSRKNGTLNISYSANDSDGDVIISILTRWYKNGAEQAALRNLTYIQSGNLTKNDLWNASVAVNDGQNVSAFVNSSGFTIENAAPAINITTLFYTLSETQLLNITLNASDIDGDNLGFSTNKSASITISPFNTSALWYTSLDDAESYQVNITVNDSTAIDSIILNITIVDARDADNDGNPDFNDTDDDNDGNLDGIDYFIGNLTSVNATPSLTLNITINGTTNFSKAYDGMIPISFTSNLSSTTRTIIEFNFTANSSNIMDFNNITINYTITGRSGLAIRGLKRSLDNFTKSAYMDKVNSTVRAVCVKDSDSSIESISSACDGASETLVSCANTSTGQYSCFDTGMQYRISGLNHSALVERCVDADGDGYGNGCALGTDECDGNAAQHTSSGCNPPSSPSSSSSGGGGGGGGGGAAVAASGITYSRYISGFEADQVVAIPITKFGLAITSLAITPKESSTGDTLTIKVIKNNETPHLNTEKVYQYADISFSKLKSAQVSEATIEFAVNKTYFTRNKLDPNSVSLQRYAGGWQTLSTQMTSEDAIAYRYSAASPGFSLFAMTAKEKAIEKPIIEQKEEAPIEKNDTDSIQSGGQESKVSAAPRKKTYRSLLISLGVAILICAFILYLTVRKHHRIQRAEQIVLHPARRAAHHARHHGRKAMNSLHETYSRLRGK